MSRSPIVIDTNVLVVADGGHEEASEGCVVRCRRRLMQIMIEGRVVIDDGYRVLKEYGRQFSSSRPPSEGQVFFKWLMNNQSNPELCEIVRITPAGANNEEETFREYPSSPELADFDPADRKFIALAAAHSRQPPIAQALDSKWWGLRDAFYDVGVEVEFLCEAEISAIYTKKFT